MLTTRISPKMSAKPLATMKRAAAKVSESRTIFRNDDGSWTAEPKFVVRQSPTPNSLGILARKRT